MVYRVYVEKKPPFSVEAGQLADEMRSFLGLETLSGLRIIQRYDVEGVSQELFSRCIPLVFSEPQVDHVFFTPPEGDRLFAVEYLPGQFDQRADSAAECIQLISQEERPTVRTARLYVLNGSLTDEQLAAVKKYVINPVEAREASLDPADTLRADYPRPAPVETLHGFRELSEEGLVRLIAERGLAMDVADAAFCREYFRKEGRDPTLTELRMIDTYWSDHCRHTTFGTRLTELSIKNETVQRSFETYCTVKKQLYPNTERPCTLMDMATIGAKYLKKQGLLKNLDESEEINACSIKIPVDIDGKSEDWLLLFKNETHNHPTEIEPFGGAATCIGGAIRDPLANRGYVYQAMRLTGAGDPTAPVEATLPGKLPQRKIVTTAAAGYSSYGNQIGLATGLVDEWIHPGYVAKRMEIGAVVGAVPEAHVRREAPEPGDLVILLGGRTGRDGCGGATGSSKAHKADSLETCGAEVQKGNPPVERKLQRLFRDPRATLLIRRCNDFGAGGVSVAIGELADGLSIDLDAVPKKYDGLDGTELAISESQERMAVVVAEKDVPRFIDLAHQENLEATIVARVTENPRLVMRWNGQTVADISREFLNSNGAAKYASVHIPDFSLDFPEQKVLSAKDFMDRLTSLAGDLNVCCKKGLGERFDSTIGAGSVLMPFGGAHQLTPPQAMAAKIPLLSGETDTCSGMAWGFDPYISKKTPYHGAYLAVAESISRLVATGFSRRRAYLTFQEYFERIGNDPLRWGKPAAALLGALQAQLDLEVAAIGGKDSMSGSFEQLDVPPTLVSFAVAPGKASQVISPEFKGAGHSVIWLRSEKCDALLPESVSLKKTLDRVEQWIREGKVLAAYTPGFGGAAAGLLKMCLGNRIGLSFDKNAPLSELFDNACGSFILEMAAPVSEGILLGSTSADYAFSFADEGSFSLSPVQECYESALEDVFPYRSPSPASSAPLVSWAGKPTASPKFGIARPKALIPVFPGTNCEVDTARAIEKAGGEAEVFLINNLSPADVSESVARFSALIAESQMIVIPGGFSGGDEPEGSGKFINAFFRNPTVSEQVHRLLEQRDGLMLGICNGFQALIKLGLVPFGRIVETDDSCPTLTFNTIGRHQSMLVRTRICSSKSPWLMHEPAGAVHTIAISHGEGRFVARPELLHELAASGQIATQYIDLEGRPTMDVRFNPNGSDWAIEGITSPDGRVLGKMGHTERCGDNLYKNVPGNKYQKLFLGGVDYFRL